MESKHPPRLWANAIFFPGERPVWTATDTEDPEPGRIEFMSVSESNALADEREARARQKGMVDGAREAGYQIMRSMQNQDEAKKAQGVCEWLAGDWEKAQAPEKERPNGQG